MDYEISSLLKIESSLVTINDFEGPLPDKTYVKGAIQWRIGESHIHMEDEMIDFLWCSIIEGLVRFKRAGDSGQIYFPSQPLTLRFSRVGENKIAKDLLRITIYDSSVVVNLALAERSLCAGGRDFLLKIRKFKSRPIFDACLQEIDKIEKTLTVEIKATEI